MVMTLLEFINEHEISVAYLAKKTGMHKSTFNNKLKGNNGSKFTHIELLHIKLIIGEIGTDAIKTSEHL